MSSKNSPTAQVVNGAIDGVAWCLAGERKAQGFTTDELLRLVCDRPEVQTAIEQGRTTPKWVRQQINLRLSHAMEDHGHPLYLRPQRVWVATRYATAEQFAQVVEHLVRRADRRSVKACQDMNTNEPATAASDPGLIAKEEAPHASRSSTAKEVRDGARSSTG